jgi:hypothetical protein
MVILFPRRAGMQLGDAGEGTEKMKISITYYRASNRSETRGHKDFIGEPDTVAAEAGAFVEAMRKRGYEIVQATNFDALETIEKVKP